MLNWFKECFEKTVVIFALATWIILIIAGAMIGNLHQEIGERYVWTFIGALVGLFFGGISVITSYGFLAFLIITGRDIKNLKDITANIQKETNKLSKKNDGAEINQSEQPDMEQTMSYNEENKKETNAGCLIFIIISLIIAFLFCMQLDNMEYNVYVEEENKRIDEINAKKISEANEVIINGKTYTKTIDEKGKIILKIKVKN